MPKDEEEQEIIGRDLVMTSLSRKRKLTPTTSSEEGSNSISGNDSTGRKKRKKLRSAAMADGLAAFSESLRDSDLGKN